jgi:hypothetical protein
MKFTGQGGEPRSSCEVRAIRRKELDGLESVPRLLFLWNRRPRIAAANPQHHVGRHNTIATMVQMAHLLSTRVVVLGYLGTFCPVSDPIEL